MVNFGADLSKIREAHLTKTVWVVVTLTRFVYPTTRVHPVSVFVIYSVIEIYLQILWSQTETEKKQE